MERTSEMINWPENKWKSVAVGAAILAVLWLGLLILFDYNRYHGFCSKREFNDSLGPLKHQLQQGDRVSCRTENETVKPPGRLPGQFFTWFDRSQPAWILVGILSCITAVANVVLICSQPKKGQYEQTKSRSFSHHQSEHGRVGWIIYVCTTVIIVYQSINIIKIFDCRPENYAEIFYTVMLALDASAQGAFILSEVAVSEYFGTKKSKLRSIVLSFIGAWNLFMWGHSITDAVCRDDLDNAAIVGYQIWDFFDPLFGSAIVFFRILSGCLYISLSLPSGHTPENDLAGKPFTRSRVASNFLVSEEDKETSLGLLEFMIRNRKIRQQTLTIFNEPEATNFYYFARNDRIQRSIVRTKYGSVAAILFVAIPFVAYDAFARHVGKEQNSQQKCTVELAANCLLIVLCSWYIIGHGVREWVTSPTCSECKKRLFGYSKRKESNTTKCAECEAPEREAPECEVPECESPQKCDTCKKCRDHCSYSCTLQKLCQKLMHTNVEVPVFFIFTLFAVAFYTTSAIVEHKEELAAEIVGIVAVICHSVFLFWTALVHNPLKLLWHGNHRHTFNSVLLSLLFATSVGLLAVDIEREHFDNNIHDKSYLRPMAPLLVDFRVHAAILTYSVLLEFFQQRPTEREIEDMEIFKKVHNQNEAPDGCFMSRCKEVYRTSTVFWKCAQIDENGCTSKPYCDKCFKEFIVKVGFCTTCGDPTTCKPLKPTSSRNTDDVSEISSQPSLQQNPDEIDVPENRNQLSVQRKPDEREPLLKRQPKIESYTEPQ